MSKSIDLRAALRAGMLIDDTCSLGVQVRVHDLKMGVTIAMGRLSDPVALEIRRNATIQPMTYPTSA